MLSAQSILSAYESGLRLLESGKISEARLKFDEIIAIRPYYYDAYVGRARTYVAEDKEKEALADFSTALGIKEGWYEALYYRGLLHFSKGRYRPALSDLEECLRNREGWLPAMLARSSVQRRLGKNADALLTLNDAVNKAKERPWLDLFIARGILLRDMGKARAGLEDISAALKMSLAPDSLLLIRSKLLLGVGDTSSAIRDLGTYLGKYPSDAAPRRERALLHVATGGCAAAVSDLNILIDEQRIKEDAVLYEARAHCYLRLGDPEKAVSDLTRATMYDRDNDGLYLQRAEAYAAQGKDNAALADFRRLIRFGSTDPRPWIGRAKYYIDRKRWDLALADLDEAVKAQPTPEGHYLRAVCYYEMKNDRKACEELDTAAGLGHQEAIRMAKEFCK